MLFTDDEVLVLYTDSKLSKNRYKILGKRFNEKICHVLPPYKRIANSKTKFYPLTSTIKFMEKVLLYNFRGY